MAGFPNIKKARNRLLADRDAGCVPGPGITPQFCDYYCHYVSWLESTQAKSPLTIAKERSSLKGWAKFLGTLRLKLITRKLVNDYVLERTDNGNGVSNRSANLDVVALGNMLKFARDEGWLKGELPTDSWKPLKYVPPRRPLLTWDQIKAICEEALATSDGRPKYENGQFLADYIKLLAFSGFAGSRAAWFITVLLRRGQPAAIQMFLLSLPSLPLAFKISRLFKLKIEDVFESNGDG